MASTKYIKPIFLDASHFWHTRTHTHDNQRGIVRYKFESYKKKVVVVVKNEIFSHCLKMPIFQHVPLHKSLHGYDKCTNIQKVVSHFSRICMLLRNYFWFCHKFIRVVHNNINFNPKHRNLPWQPLGDTLVTPRYMMLLHLF